MHRLRRELEAFHGEANPKALAVVWPQLAHEDRAIRSAARAALGVDGCERTEDSAARDVRFRRTESAPTPMVAPDFDDVREPLR